MTETPETPALSPQTAASVQGVVRAKNELEQWTKNLEQALADDLAATPPRLTHDQAAAVAKTYGVHAPAAHKQPEPEAHHPPAHPAEHHPERPAADTAHKASDEKAKKPATTR